MWLPPSAILTSCNHLWEAGEQLLDILWFNHITWDLINHLETSHKSCVCYWRIFLKGIRYKAIQRNSFLEKHKLCKFVINSWNEIILYQRTTLLVFCVCTKLNIYVLQNSWSNERQWENQSIEQLQDNLQQQKWNLF